MVTIPVLVNRAGGSADAHDAGEIVAAFARVGLAVAVEALDGADLAARAAALAAAGATRLIAAGGDGTISAVAGALAGTETVLGVLPLGTLNHFARDLGLPFALDEAAAALARAVPRAIDLASVNGVTFINNGAIGLYPMMVLDRDRQQSQLGRSKRLAMLVAAIRTLVRFKPERLRLTINDRAESDVATPLLFVGNNDYRTDLNAPGCRDRLTDGRLCVLVLRSKTRAGLFAAMVRATFGIDRPDEMLRLEDVRRLRVDSDRPRLTISRDGETETFPPPLDYRIHPGALRVLAEADPRRAEEG